MIWLRVACLIRAGLASGRFGQRGLPIPSPGRSSRGRTGTFWDISGHRPGQNRGTFVWGVLMSHLSTLFSAQPTARRNAGWRCAHQLCASKITHTAPARHRLLTRPSSSAEIKLHLGQRRRSRSEQSSCETLHRAPLRPLRRDATTALIVFQDAPDDFIVVDPPQPPHPQINIVRLKFDPSHGRSLILMIRCCAR